MPNIKPISALKNYQDLVEEVREDAPVYLTKNGTGKCALVDIGYVDEHDRLRAELDLLSELYKGKESGDTQGWVSIEDAAKRLGLEL